MPETAAASGAEREPHPRLGAALAGLPPKQRAAVSFHYIGGLSYARVAALLGTTAVAARRSAADGIASLRTRLGKGG